SEKEFVEIIKIVSKKRIDAIELNLSCPNFENEKKMISQSSELTFKIVKSVKNETDIPVIVKLTPNVTEIKEIAISAEEGGADILSLINTIKGLAVDFKKMRVIDGGLSGPSIKPVGLKCVYDVYKVVNIPIIGMGGITCGLDAIEYFLVGASAIGIGSGFYSNPQIIDDIYKTLKNFLRKNKFKSIREMIGLLNEKKENF
ncbi:MAG: dihydroorotate dehydrogenase, partial [Candidatus Omnitrophica bacterium]|nr:dihydroorotate dehydrogenase [Candidatus Omnitrophota bacterium]